MSWILCYSAEAICHCGGGAFHVIQPKAEAPHDPDIATDITKLDANLPPFLHLPLRGQVAS